MSTIKISWTEYTDDGDEVEHELPASYEVCTRCDGKGKHVNPSIDSHGITAEEWDRDWSDEEREGYFNGMYDVRCEACKGLRVIAYVDVDRLPPSLRARYEAQEEGKRRDREQEAHERRMGY